MTPRFELSGLKKARPWEYLLRFAFGGVITVLAGLAARAWGPAVGGLFLGFPSILPASLTLAKEHDGRAQAAEDARGGRLGSIGLMAFAALLWATARSWPAAVVLAAATAAWVLVDALAWWTKYHRAPPS